jgi:hypothetical protein
MNSFLTLAGLMSVFLALCVEELQHRRIPVSDRGVGVDLGITNALSDGKTIEATKFLRKAE